LLNDQSAIDEIKEEIKMFLEVNENETQPTRTYGTCKDCPNGKFIAMSAYIKRSEGSQINDLILQLKLLEKQEQANPKTSRRAKIIKIRLKSSK
jgi:hypothetical protein